MATRSRRGFGAIRKLNSGRWQASYISPTGERLTAPMTFGAKIDAGRFLNNVRYEIDNNLWKNPKAKVDLLTGITFGDFAATHLLPPSIYMSGLL